jgi:hypothetical protein
VINTSYMMVRYPRSSSAWQLGIVGYTTSALVRIAGDYLMNARAQLALFER